MDFSEKKVWITGASSGIGAALALELSRCRANLILSARNAGALHEVKQRCKYPDRVQVFPLDLEDHRSIAQKVKAVLEEVGSIDYLVNNAGLSQRSYAADTRLEVDEQLMKVNFLGTVALTKAVLPDMIKRRQGKIVTVTSMVGKYGTPKRSSYAASKHALHGFFDSLRAEIYREGVKIQLICPGYVKTNISVNALTADGSSQGTMDRATAKGISPDDFARRMASAMCTNRDEVYICGLKERAGLYLKRFAPGLFNRLVRRIAVT
jgi:short-subunit dehydrogenase